MVPDYRLREMDTIKVMVGIYCRGKHNSQEGLCSDCDSLLRYSLERLEHCVWGANKPVCARCAVHCYAPKYRAKIQQVMRFAGPRMIFKHPLHAIRHFLHKLHRQAEVD